MTTGDRPDAERIRLLVVDDHPAVREGLAILVSSDGIDVVAEAERTREALAALEHCQPHLAVVDLSLDDEDGLALVAELAARHVPVLVYSMHHDARHVHGAFAAGALGYVDEGGVPRRARRGHSVGRGRAQVREPEGGRGAGRRRDATDGWGRVRPPQRQGTPGVRTGRPGRGLYEIAKAMQISTHTVESYCARIQQKLGLTGMYELRRHAIDHRRQQPR